jgi:hypothetical protein
MYVCCAVVLLQDLLGEVKGHISTLLPAYKAISCLLSSCYVYFAHAMSAVLLPLPTGLAG